MATLFGSAVTANTSAANGANTGRVQENQVKEFFVSGVLNGATVTLEMSFDGGTTFVPSLDPTHALTVAGFISVPVSKSAVYSASVSSVGGSTSVTFGFS